MSDWNTKIIEEFRANEGRVGGPFEGGTLLLLHHTGARTGTERVSPLAYFPDDDRMVIVASKGGAPSNPDWYHNLKANPTATVEVGTETVPVTAVELTGDEYDETWARVTAKMPGFAEYQTRTARRIPLFALHRTV
ncbi:nitroreductase family deazaflavin-dependent oxidoreductase [Micromonosporaceae bacterium Da 78-11]